MAFKVMTWNLENLFPPGSQFGPATQAVYDEKLDGLADVINAEAPDALALQEVGEVQGQPKPLDDLVQRLNGNWHQRVSLHPDGRGIRVAWLSQHEITNPEQILPFPAPLQPVQSDDTGGTEPEMGRGAVAMTVTSQLGQQIRLITAHLKSKLLTFPGGRFHPRDESERARFAAYALYRRSAETATLRTWATNALTGQPPIAPIVVCGDLNDTVQAATTQLLLGPPGSEIDTRGFKIPDQGDAQRLWNLASLMPGGRNYSRINHGRPELIDHILVSELLVKSVDVNSVGAVVTTPLPSIAPEPTARLNEPSSDHAPVVATFHV
jgi:endonuclease/exonuclease/phosphatase family metal-dependent hydrolase